MLDPLEALKRWRRREAAQARLLAAAKLCMGGLDKSYELMNAYASGETQRQFSRMDPGLILAQVYGDLAPGTLALKAALKEVES